MKREKIVFENKYWMICCWDKARLEIYSKTKVYADGFPVMCGCFRKLFDVDKPVWIFRHSCVPHYIINKVLYFWKMRRLL